MEDSAAKESSLRVRAVDGGANRGLGRKNQIVVTGAGGGVAEAQVLTFSAASEKEQMDWLAEVSRSSGAGHETKEEGGFSL